VSDAIKIFKYIPLAGEYIQSVGLNSSYQYSRDLIRQFSDDGTATWDDYKFKYAFAPLARLSLELKNKLRLSNDFNYSYDRAYNTQKNANRKASENSRWSNKTSLSYSFTKQQPIKILMWEISFDNQLSVSLDWQYGASTDYKWDVWIDNKEYATLKDYLSYDNNLQHENRTIDNAISASASYKVSAKVDAGGSASWKKTVKVLPGLEDDNAANHPEYSVGVEIWVKWTF
jgi:hypothetical protein